jgi:hypothetical protein
MLDLRFQGAEPVEQTAVTDQSLGMVHILVVAQMASLPRAAMQEFFLCSALHLLV